MGFQGVIMGIWDVSSMEEMENAVEAQGYVDGYCVGNEGLYVRYELAALQRAMDVLREKTKKPVTTTEEIDDYAHDEVFALGDWIFPNIHPFLSEVRDPLRAARWIESHYKRLQKHISSDRVVFFKEVGYPTRGMWEATQKNQLRFFRFIQGRKVPFVYFEAFDQPWKNHLACEPHWGLFRNNRKPKKFIAQEMAMKE